MSFTLHPERLEAVLRFHDAHRSTKDGLTCASGERIAGTCRWKRPSACSAASQPRSTRAPASDGCASSPVPTPPTTRTASAWSRRSWSSPCPGSRSSRRPRPRDESGSPTCPGCSASARRRSCSAPARGCALGPTCSCATARASPTPAASASPVTSGSASTCRPSAAPRADSPASTGRWGHAAAAGPGCATGASGWGWCCARARACGRFTSRPAGRSASATRARSCSPPARATASPSRRDEPTCSSTRSAAPLLLPLHQILHLVVQRPHPVLDLRRARELLGGEHLANVERRGHGVIHELLARAREAVKLGLQVADLQVASREELVEERGLPRAHLAHERARLRAPIGHDLLHLRLLLVGEIRAPQQERQHHGRAVAPVPHHH